MANVTDNLLYGHINSTHTSSITPYYPPGSIPTPWPILVLSVLLSLAISCYGLTPAFGSLGDTVSQVRRLPKSPWAKKIESERESGRRESAIHETELEDLHVTKSFDPPPPYTSEEGESSGGIDPEAVPASLVENRPESTHELVERSENTLERPDSPEELINPLKWNPSPRRKTIEILIFAFSTFRAVVAVIISIEWPVTKKTPLSAPSNLLCLLVSIQILIANASLPRVIRGILTIDVILVTVAFGITGFAPLAGEQNTLRAYGELAVIGGTCPVYANNCVWQSTHWEKVGCGNYTQLVDNEDHDEDAKPLSGSDPNGAFVPYATTGDLNRSMNPLHIVETIIFVFGVVWLLSVFFQVYESRYLISPRKVRERLPGERYKGRTGVMCMGIVALFGVIGAFVATFMSIGAHISQAVGSHHSTYLDSLGPVVMVNGTYEDDKYGNDVIIGAQYWGNATSWNDCFVLTAPTGTSRIWSEWVEQNRGTLYRIAAGL